MKQLLITSLLVLFIFQAYSQNFTISGYVQDDDTGEKLVGANIYDIDKLLGTTSNAYGFYSMTLPKGQTKIKFSFIGYKAQIMEIDLVKNIHLNVELKTSAELSEIEVTADRIDRDVKSTQMSSIKLSVKKIEELPALLGEVDVIKALQLLPGVQSGTEGASGLYVRGGGPDQNLILLDGTPVYNASHLFGFFSVFNTDAINNIELIKGGFPARYGGRLSSVLDIGLKEGNMKKIKGSVFIGLISAKATIEGPIIKDKTSFIVSARRTYLDYLAQPLIKLASEDGDVNQGYFFYDINAKINHKISNKDRLYLSVYTGEDKFYRNVAPYDYLYDGKIYTEESKSGLGWGNITSAFRWNRQWNDKLFGNTTITYSNYNFNVNDFQQSIIETDTGNVTKLNSLKYLSGIEDYTAKFDFDYLPHPDHYIKFGASNIFHTFKPGVSVYKIEGVETTKVDTTMGESRIQANEYAFYIEDDYKISGVLKANIGLHYSGFYVNDKLYHSLQPRISLRYLLSENWSAKISYAKMSQYIHLLTNNNIGLPTDLWVPTTDRILPQQSHQVAAGIATVFNDKYQLSVEGYYKTMDNLIEYKDGASFMGTNEGWEDKVEQGKGWSYGGELFLEKKMGIFTGWIGYTLSWTNRQFDNINNGEIFPYKYDRRHDISVVLSVPLGETWNLSASWVYGTGTAHTLPTERYFGDGNSGYSGLYGGGISSQNSGLFGGEISHVDGRNSIRAADYHRLDVNFSKKQKIKYGDMTFNIGVYNAYNRKNPFYYYIGYDKKGNRALKRVSLFPFIPSISWKFIF